MQPPKRFEVRPLVYGGAPGAMLSSHETLEEAEAAHSTSIDSQDIFIILGPDPKDPDGPLKPVVYSRRIGKGDWVREF